MCLSEVSECLFGVWYKISGGSEWSECVLFAVYVIWGSEWSKCVFCGFFKICGGVSGQIVLCVV